MLWGQSAGDGYGGDYNPTSPDDPAMPTPPPTRYNFELVPTDGGRGYVEGESNKTKLSLPEGYWVRLHTQASKEHFYFVHWLQGDSIISTNSTFSYCMPAKDVALTAVFEYDPGQYGEGYNPATPGDPTTPVNSYQVTAVASPSDGGSVDFSSSKIQVGSSTYVSASPYSGYRFRGWQRDGEIVSTEPYYTFTMGDGDANFKALFEYLPTMPNDPSDNGTVTTYSLSYVIDGHTYYSEQLVAGTPITPIENPVRKGYIFNGWSELPDSMPGNNLIIQGSFTVKKHQIQFVVENNVLRSDSVTYGSVITYPEVEQREGYTFTWTDKQTVMPDNDVIAYGEYAVIKYTLVYRIDGTEYKRVEYEAGATVTPEPDPVKEGHTFLGWTGVPTTMPAYYVVVKGSYSVNTYKITYAIDGKELQTDSVKYNSRLVGPEAPAKEGHTFIGWTDLPARMPAKDLTINGNYQINKYKLTYKVDGKVFKQYEVDYAAAPTIEEIPFKEGYTFSGWSEIPATMPAEDVVIEGKFTQNSYVASYVLDGEVLANDTVLFGSRLTTPSVPIKEGYTFSGWSGVPTTMPAGNVTIEGHYIVNSYKVTFILDGEVYWTDSVQYATLITVPEVEARDGLAFSGWGEIPESMPANDLIFRGAFVSAVYALTYMVDGVVYRDTTYQYGDEVANSEKNVPIPTKEGYTFSGWSEVPETMPANDVTVTGSFTINGYKLTYMVDGVVYRDTTYQYGDEVANSEKNVPIPTKEGYTFSGWSEIPETMPANDVIVTGNFILTQKAATPQSEVIYEEGTAKVILTTSTAGAVIYYTLDGSTPTTSSTLYNGAFYVKDNCLLKAMAVCDGYNDSELLECNIFVNTLEVESPWVGATLNDGLSAYLYNPKAKAFLGAANQWGTQASFVSEGVEWLVSGSDGVYTLSGSISNGGDSHYFNGLWNDASATDFKIEMVGVNLYTIKLNGSYVAYSDATIVDTIAELTDGCYWQFVTKEERRSKYAEATAAEPVNATFEILGANFGRNDTNNSAWSGSPAVGGSYDNFCGEKWNAGVVEVSQVLRNMPSGKYRLSVQGFYRMGSMEEVTAARTNGTEVLHAQFFANDVSVPVMSILDEAGKLEGVGNSGYGDYGLAPNSMSEASQFFSAGLYEHSFLFTLGGGVDTIRLGVATTGFVAQDWVIFDNFRLEYLGEGSESDFFASGLLTSIPEGYHYVYYTDNKGNHHYLYAAGQNDWAVSDIPSIIKFSAGNTTEDPYATSASFMENSGYYMSNAANGDGTGPIKTELVEGVNGSKKRTWESQVFYKNAAGKYAIRLTNSKGESWGANSFVNIDPVTLAISSGLPSLGDALYLWNVVDCNEDNVQREALDNLIKKAESIEGTFNNDVRAALEEAILAARKAVPDEYAAMLLLLESAIADVEASKILYQEIDREIEACKTILFETAAYYEEFAKMIEQTEQLYLSGTAIAENLADLRWGKDEYLRQNEVHDVIVNADFSDGNGGWTDALNSGNHNKWTNINEGFVEKWVSVPSSLQDFDFYQEINGLPAGTYTFAAYVCACQQGEDDTYEVKGVQLYANDNAIPVHTINIDRNEENQKIGAELVMVTATISKGETLKVGLSVTSTDANWVVMDNAKLYRFDVSQEYTLTYVLDGEIYKTYTYEEGMTIIPEDAPIKKGHAFSGWEGLPEIMPAEDVTVTGSFTVNTYQVTYILDGKAYMVQMYKYGEAIKTPQAPEKEGYTFDGWGDVPVTMPADNLTLVGKYVLNEIQTDDNGFVYDLNDTKDGFALSDFGDNALIDVVVPEEIQGLPVTKIQAGAFEQASEMKTIVVPHSVTRVDDHAFSGCYNLQVVEWNADAPLKSAYFDDMDKYGNMLVFTTSAVSVDEFDGNVVVDGVAEEIVLTDGRPFNNPRDFVAHNVSFSREFEKIEKIGNLGGWRAMILPFDVQLITQLDTASSISNKIRTSAVSLPYWIAEVYDGTSNVFTPIEKITANRPFIIEIPNEGFDESFGDVVFSSENVTVHSTLLDGSQVEGDFVLVGVYDTTSLVTNVYTLNDEEFVSVDGDVFSPGSVFVESNRAIQPFEAYVQCSSMDTPPYYRIRGRSGTDIEDVFMDALSTFDEDAWYTLQGVRLNGRPQEKGLYIYRNQVVYVK